MSTSALRVRKVERCRERGGRKVTAKESSGSIWQLQANGAENGDTETRQNDAPKRVC